MKRLFNAYANSEKWRQGVAELPAIGLPAKHFGSEKEELTTEDTEGRIPLHLNRASQRYAGQEATAGQVREIATKSTKGTDGAGARWGVDSGEKWNYNRNEGGRP